MQTFKIEKTDTQCVVTWYYFSGCILLFMLVWLGGWTVGCGLLTHLVVVEQELWALLFALPFWFFWFGGFAMLANTLFGKMRFVLDETGFESTWTCLFVKRTKRIDLASIHWFERFETDTEGGEVTGQLRVVCQTKNAEYYCLPKNVKDIEALCEQLNAFLQTLHRSAGIPVVDVPRVPAKLDVVFKLRSAPQYLPIPLSCRWNVETGFNDFGFWFKEKGAIIILFVLLPFATFWNGIVSVFVLALFRVLFLEEQPKGWDWWLVFLFLIPFIIIGLCLIVAVLNCFLNLFRVQKRWTFSYGSATSYTARLGPTRVEHFDLAGWKSLVVRVSADKKDEAAMEPDDTYSTCWQLAFLNTAGELLLAIENLSKSEALWMADVILREQRMIQ